jgi:hypothetical protein
MNTGKLIINFIALAMVIIPPLMLVFPRRSSAPGQTLLRNYPQFRMFARDSDTILTMRMLRIGDAWINKQSSSIYIKIAMVVLIAGLLSYLLFGASIVIVLALIVVIDITVAPMLTISLLKMELRSRFRKERDVYSRVITKSLIVMAAQFRSDMTSEAVIGKLASDMPSAATQRFVEDIKTFRQIAASNAGTNEDTNTSLGGALYELGKFWKLGTVSLVGQLLQTKGLSEADVADQMTSQVRLSFAHELMEDSRFYKSREGMMTAVMLFTFLGVLLLPVVPVLIRALSSGNL